MKLAYALIPVAALLLAANADAQTKIWRCGNSYTNDVIDAYIGLKMQEVTRYRMSTHPVELDMYYSC